MGIIMSGCGMRLPEIKYMTIRDIRFSVVIMIALLFSFTLQAEDLIEITPAVGVHIDVAPFGIEQYMAAVQCSLFLNEFTYIGLKPSVLWNNRVKIARFPAVVNLPVLRIDSFNAGFDLYGGCGPEVYRTETHDADSAFIVAGAVLSIENVCLDLYVSRAYRDFNTDSDLGVLVGYRF